MPKQAIGPLAAALLVLSISAAGAQAPDTPAAAATAPSSGMPSVINAAPQVLYGMMRYPKFYDDPNMDRATIDGSLLDRQYLLGSLWGARDDLARYGLIFNAGVTQVYQGTASGSGDSGQYLGSADLWAAFDAGRAGLWPGGVVFAHLEGTWGRSVRGTGALLPLNFDGTMPASPAAWALSELYLFQALPAGFALIAGKINWSAYADTNLFANNERTQFLYTGLVNNPILGAFVPYTSLGAGLFKQFGSEFQVGLVATSNATNAVTSGFNELSGTSMTYGIAANWTPTVAGLPGMYNVLLGYTSRNATAFDVDPRYFVGEIIGRAPVIQKDGNYAVALSASQYAWRDASARRSDGLPVGFGPFFRFGIAPADRNIIDQFYSVGVGGNGGPFGRVNDNWGIGVAWTHFSSDLRDNINTFGDRVSSYERAAEAFYNIALTLAVRLSGHVQYIDSANRSRDNAVVLALRLQWDL